MYKTNWVIIYLSQGPKKRGGGLGNYVYQVVRLCLCDLKCKILCMMILHFILSCFHVVSPTEAR